MDSKSKLYLSRLLSRVERLETGAALPEIENPQPLGSAFRIGVTGPVGAGKSTLINRLAREFRNLGHTVGIIAVDPSSPFTGGAVLGDRVRMSDLALDEGVFIRSLATRGAFGGLAACAEDAADLVDMFGYNRIIIETVGVGQTEVDIVEACDATMVVLAPESGDDVQAIKAGLMEIADIFAVNKMDIRGADRFLSDLETALAMRDPESRLRAFPVQSNNGTGIRQLTNYLESYFDDARRAGTLTQRRTGQRARRIKRLAKNLLINRLWSRLSVEELTAVVESGLPARDAAAALVEKLVQRG